MASQADSPDEILAHVRGGQQQRLGDLLQLYRNYLYLVARTQIDLYLRGRVSASDLVQESFLEANRDFHRFQGHSGQEFLGWLRGILLHNIATQVQRQVMSQKRDARREVPLGTHLAALEQSTARLDAALVSQRSSPSENAQRHESAVILANQMARLPARYRDVLTLRNLEGLSFEQVAQRMGCTVGSARLLWVRAVQKLRVYLEELDLI